MSNFDIRKYPKYPFVMTWAWTLDTYIEKWLYCQLLPKWCDVHFKFWRLVLGYMPQVSLPWKQVKARGAIFSLHILFCCPLKQFRPRLIYYLTIVYVLQGEKLSEVKDLYLIEVIYETSIKSTLFYIF